MKSRGSTPDRLGGYKGNYLNAPHGAETEIYGMGMYTELLLKAQLKDEAPDSVRGVLRFLFNKGAEPEELPNHPFFTLDRWSQIGRCSSAYHIPWTDSHYDEEYGYIFSRSDLKNYSGEIDALLSWIAPYLRGEDGMCIGWSWYEESIQPTLLILSGGAVTSVYPSCDQK
ncbi:MAG: hypothetical protein ABFD89_06325 [Bryobacteraceae bacterium]